MKVKKFLALFLTLCMVIGLLPATAMADGESATTAKTITAVSLEAQAKDDTYCIGNATYFIGASMTPINSNDFKWYKDGSNKLRIIAPVEDGVDYLFGTNAAVTLNVNEGQTADLSGMVDLAYAVGSSVKTFTTKPAFSIHLQPKAAALTLPNGTRITDYVNSESVITIALNGQGGFDFGADKDVKVAKDLYIGEHDRVKLTGEAKLVLDKTDASVSALTKNIGQDKALGKLGDIVTSGVESMKVISTEDGDKTVFQLVNSTGYTAKLYVGDSESDIFTYTGEAIEPNVKVFDSAGKAADVTTDVVYSDNINAGVATVKITVKDGEKVVGQIEKTFTIIPADISNSTKFTVGFDTLDGIVYDGDEKKLSGITVKPVDKQSITEEGNYTVTYANNVNAGTAEVTVQGVGNYTGSVTQTFKIAPKELNAADVNVSLPKASIVYNAAAQEPEVQAELKENTEKTLTFSVSYFNNINAAQGSSSGSATDAAPENGPYAAVTFNGNYSGTVYVPFTIAAYTLSDKDTMNLAANRFVYDGTAKLPAVTVSTPFATLVEGTDFNLVVENGSVISYGGITGPSGKYKVVARGTTNYTGSMSAEFEIVPAARNITVSPDTVYVTQGKTASLNIIDNAGRTGGFTFTGKDTNGTSINNSGVVTAGATTGSYEFTVTAAAVENYQPLTEDAGRTVTVVVVDKPMQTVTYNDGSDSQTIFNGVDSSIGAFAVSSVATEGGAKIADAKFTYTSSNTSVAEIGEDGKVTVKGVGQTILTATAQESDYASAAQSITLTVNPVPLTVTWDMGEGVYTYDGTKKVIKAKIDGIKSEFAPVINNQEAADEDGKYTIDTQTNAGSYTAAITLSGPNAGYYTFAQPKDTAKSWTINKAQLVIESIAEGTLENNAYTVGDAVTTLPNLTLSVATEQEKSVDAKNYTAAYSSSDTKVATVNWKGEPTVTGNGEVTFTVRLPESANYLGTQGTITYARVIKDAITSINGVNGGNDKTFVEAALDNGKHTISLMGMVADGDALTVSYVNDNGDRNAVTVKLSGVTVTDIQKPEQNQDTVTLSGKELTVNGVAYTVKVSLYAAPSNISYGTAVPERTEINTDGLTNDQKNIAKDVDTALKTTTGVSTSSLLAVAAKTLTAVNEKAATSGDYNNADGLKAAAQTNAPGANVDWLETPANVEVSVEVGMEIEPSFSADGNLSFEIKPVYNVYANDKTGANERLLLEKDKLTEADGSLPGGQKLTVSVPVGSLNPNFAVHTKDKEFKGRLPVTVNGGNATFTTDSFSSFELVQNNFSMTLVTKAYLESDSSQTLTYGDFDDGDEYALDGKWTKTNNGGDTVLVTKIKGVTDDAANPEASSNELEAASGDTITLYRYDAGKLSFAANDSIMGTVKAITKAYNGTDDVDLTSGDGFGAGRTVTLTATPTDEAEYRFVEWTVSVDDNEETKTGAELVYTMPYAKKVVITANFAPVEYMVTVENVAGGSIALSKTDNTPINTGDLVAFGTEVLVELTPDTGYTSENGYTLNSVAAGNSSKSFTMPAEAVTVSTKFIKGSTVTFVFNDDTTDPVSYKTDPKTFVLNELPATPSREGYKFLGWFTDAEKGEQVTVKVGDVFDTDTTLYAHWEQKATNNTSSSGGGGGGAASTVNTGTMTNGSVKISNRSAAAGAKVTLTPTPNNGYKLDTLTVKDKNGATVELTKNADGTYTFTMPAKNLQPVKIEASFVKEGETAPVTPDGKGGFTDVPADAFYAAAVKWAVEKNVTNGVDSTHFAPDASCTRAQMVTFLWRAAGSPEPTGSASFGDVVSGSYYEKAVAWAVEQGITNGTGEGTFSPDDTVTRAQVVTFLYRYEKAEAGTQSGFADVAEDAWFASAVTWAVEQGITNGTGDGQFSPANDCTRGQIVTFLWRDMGK